MSGTSRKMPDNVAEILKEFKTQRSATRPMVGVGNRNFFLLGQQGTTLDDETTHVPPTKLKFESFDTTQPDSTEADYAYNLPSTSTNTSRPSLGLSIKRPMDATPAGIHHAKRLAPSPGIILNECFSTVLIFFPALVINNRCARVQCIQYDEYDTEALYCILYAYIMHTVKYA